MTARPSTTIVKHIDRCLSCLSCMTTCPSDVNYMHLVDHARAYIEETYRRPPIDRAVRALLAAVLPHPRRFRAGAAAGAACSAARSGCSERLRRCGHWPRCSLWRPRACRAARLRRQTASGSACERTRRAAAGLRRSRCCDPASEAPCGCSIASASMSCLPPGEGCCGALVHHMGARGRQPCRRAAQCRCVDAADRPGRAGRDRHHGFRLRHDDQGLRLHAAGRPCLRRTAARVSALAKDITEFLATLICRPATAVG